ncbi:MAG: carboxypeptidase-like regulatory domain-containing protein [Geodermatophilaceae bacterium]
MSAETPFGRTTQALLETLRAGITDGDVAAGPPRADLTVAGVDVHLLGGRQGAPAQHLDRRRQPVLLEYVVALSGPPDVMADRYHDAWVTLHDGGMFEVEPDGVPAEFWTAFGVLPRPALRVSVRVTLEREVVLAPVVTEALIIRHLADLPARRLRGRVLLGDARPVEGAVVSPLSSALSATTDADGRFEISAVFDSDVVSVQVRHRHRRVVTEVAVDGDPIDIQLEGRN